MSSMVIPAFGEHGLDPVEHNADLLFRSSGGLPVLESRPMRPAMYSVLPTSTPSLKGRLHGLGKIDIAPGGLRFALFWHSLSEEAHRPENDRRDQHEHLFHFGSPF